MASNPLRAICDHGQSIWLDNLTRAMLRDGTLKRLIVEDGLSGVTSNPAIFNKAMTQGTAYDPQIRTLAEQGRNAEEIYEALAIQDVQDACDLLRPAFDNANGTDGFVSLEVSPHLASVGRVRIVDGEFLRLFDPILWYLAQVCAGVINDDWRTGHARSNHERFDLRWFLCKGTWIGHIRGRDDHSFTRCQQQNDDEAQSDKVA